jgi:molybdenum cofactor synthesis domain-containing protein
VSPGSGAPLRSVEEARLRILEAIPGPTGTETVPLGEALWRVAAEAIAARTSLPPWDNSAMDGYAIRSEDVAGATEAQPVRLRVVGEAAAGRDPTASVAPGTAVRIATGAPVPAGADAVVPVELTTPIDPGGRAGDRGREATGQLPSACLVHEAVAVGGSIRPAGSDLLDGAVLVPPGTGLTPAALALLAGAGHGTVTVYRRPRVAVLATGDEVRAPGQPLGTSGIPDANGPALAAAVRAAGGEPIELGIAPDQLQVVVDRLRGGLEDGADVVLVAGGVSVGPYDVVKGAFETIGHVDLWRVAVQPGKPFAFGLANVPEDRPAPLLFGLPGNPVSSAVTFELFVRPALRRLEGRLDLLRHPDRAVLREPVTKSAGRRAYLRVSVERDATGTPLRDDQGRLSVSLAGGQGSHVLSALAAADGLAIIPESSDSLPAGAAVELWWLDQA